jgi:glycosyltransferase involved in cell wall biosynthesis
MAMAEPGPVDAGVQRAMNGTPQQARVVVSITPVALRSDTRTFKQAASVARLGYRSIVVEGQPSGFTDGLPFELVSMSGASSAERTRRERLKVLRRWEAELRRQCSIARTVLADHRNCVEDLRRAITEIPPEFVNRGELEAMLANLDALPARLEEFEEKRGEYARDAAGETSAASKSSDEIDEMIDTCSDKLKHIYSELDAMTHSRTMLVEQLGRWRRVAANRAAEMQASSPTDRTAALSGLAAFPGRAVSGIRSSARAMLRLAMKAWARARRELRNLGTRRRDKLARWRYSVHAMFLRHVRDYTLVHVFGPLRCTPKASLYYLHSFYQFPAVYLLCLWHRARFVYDAHDFYSDMHDHAALSSYWRTWVLPFEGLIERACVSRAAAVVTVNDGIAKLIKQRFGRTAVVLRNAHDPRFEKSVEATIKDVVRIGSGEFLIVCVGQFKVGMAVEEAVRAIAFLPKRYHLAFVGGGYRSCAAHLAREMSDRVHFLPPAEPAQVVPFIRSADAGIVLYQPLSMNLRNCLPNGFFQPVAAGLPVLYPELPEIRRIAEQYELGVPIDPRDPASIAAGACRLAEDRTLTVRLKSNIEKCRGMLSWEHEEQQLRQLLATLAGAPLIRPVDVPLSCQ